MSDLSPYAFRPWLKHYDYWVPHEPTCPRVPLSELLDRAAIDFPERPATAFFGAVLTFGDIKLRSDRLATALGRLGLAKGDRVGIMLPNCPQYVIAAFAVLRHGAIVVNINPTYTPREVLTVAGDSGFRFLITLDHLAPLALGIRDQTSIEQIIVSSLAEYSRPSGPASDVEGTLSFDTLINDVERPSVICPPIDPDDIAVLQYTGGTTGRPKGAMLSHANIFANVVQTELWMYPNRRSAEARYLMVIPTFHIYGFTVGLMMGTWVGAMQILVPKYDPDLVLDAVREYRPTYFPAVPTVFISILHHPRATGLGLEQVQIFKTGGAPCPIEVIERWERTFGRPLSQGYGLSEASPITHNTPQFAIRKPGTIGVPLPGTDIKIVDLETGTRELPVGESGELCICGPQVMRGYWKCEHETATALRTDARGRTWLHTGDVARMDEDGFTTIVQRKKDLIIVNGFNVYPSEVEAVLYMHPAVRLAAVVGVPNSRHGEVVRACVVLKEKAAVDVPTLLTHCRAELAPYKVPRQIQIRESLPTSAVGKILYRVLREEIEPH